MARPSEERIGNLDGRCTEALIWELMLLGNFHSLRSFLFYYRFSITNQKIYFDFKSMFTYQNIA